MKRSWSRCPLSQSQNPQTLVAASGPSHGPCCWLSAEQCATTRRRASSLRRDVLRPGIACMTRVILISGSAFMTLGRAIGHQGAIPIMTAVTGGRPGNALEALDQAHAQLAAGRSGCTVRELEAVRAANLPDSTTPTRRRHTVGELARHVGVTPATRPADGKKPASCNHADTQRAPRIHKGRRPRCR